MERTEPIRTSSVAAVRPLPCWGFETLKYGLEVILVPANIRLQPRELPCPFHLVVVVFICSVTMPPLLLHRVIRGSISQVRN